MKTLDIWNQLAGKPFGKTLFSLLFCFKAPYFGSIKPRFVELRPEYCKLTMKKHRAVLNHMGSVHAIAICNMAEAAGGTLTEVTVPPTHRWIPRGMTVEYVKKAGTDLVAVATTDSEPTWTRAEDYKVKVIVSDSHGETVFQAIITMWVSPKKTQALV